MEQDTKQLELFYRFGSALVLGLLVGLQREHAARREADEHLGSFAGARTYALLALLGCSAAFVGESAGSVWIMGAVLLMLGAILAVGYGVSAQRGDLGITSEVAAIITVLAGALCLWGQVTIAAALAVTTTVLLALKLQTRSLAARLSDEDVRATLTFAVLTLVVLPVLPRESLAPAPFDVLVPYQIWLMVVFISGISFSGYVLIKLLGSRRGVGITGLLGGLASSTAVTVSFARRSHDAITLVKPFALAILLAWTVMFVRVLVEVAALNMALLRIVAVPMLAAATVSVIYCGYLFFSGREDHNEPHGNFTNPFDLVPALTFGAIYVLILLVANVARIHFGDTGLYVSSIISGLADVDAITLSMAELSQSDAGLNRDTAARAIVLAAASNTLVKGVIVLTLGSTALRRVIWPGLVLTLGTAIAVVFIL
ncbi:MAG: uncharacterized membrane protein (DUF4010 family) [Gammaproteobacteria bacterium]|jgi:uncharacterized membrane protein (DUF4010 family)